MAVRLRTYERGGLAVVLGLALAIAAFTLFASCGGTAGTTTSAAAGGPSGGSRSVTFESADNITLSGRVFGSGTAGVVLAHMYPADQTSWFPTAQELEAQGFLVLTFDFRGYGDSSGSKEINQIDRDVEAAIREIESLGADKVALVGASMGGTASLIAAARQPVAAVATLSAPVEFQGLSARQAVTQVKAPKLFLAAEKDVGAQGAEELFQLASEPKQIKILPGSAHGTDLLNGSSQAETRTILFSFLQKYLAQSGS